MLRVAWRNVKLRPERLFMSFLAIVLGVAFVSGSLIFVSTLDRALLGTTSSRVADVMVRSFGDDGAGEPTGSIDAAILKDVRDVDGVAEAHGRVWSAATFVIDKEGAAVGVQGQPAIGMNFFEAPAADGLQGPTLTLGRAPRADHEVTIDPKTADNTGYGIGDEIRVATDGSRPQVTVTVVGLATYGSSTSGGSVVMFTKHAARVLFLNGEKRFHDLWEVADEGVDQADLMRRVGAVLPPSARAFTGDRAAAQAASTLQQNLGFLTAFLLLFAVISLAVGAFLIMNTFSILVSQRTRELALMRAIGASRWQVTTSVLIEAFLISALGSTIGLLVGWVLARLASYGAGFFGPDLSDAPIIVPTWTIVTALAVGIGITMLSGLFPALKASSVPPVTAMRATADPVTETSSFRLRAGAVLLAIAAIALWFASGDAARIAALGIGALSLLLGVIAWAPSIVTPILWTAKWIFTIPFGIVGFLARRNTLRNPRRTAATASALTIGVTLVSMMTVFGESAKVSIDTLIAKNFKGDFVVFNPVGAPFSPELVHKVREVEGIETTARLRYSGGFVGTRPDAVAGVDPKAFNKIVALDLVEGRLPRAGKVELMVQQDRAEEQGLNAGDRVRVSAGGPPIQATVSGIYAKNPAVLLRYIGSLRLYDAAGGQPNDQFLYAAVGEGLNAAQVRPNVEAALAEAPAVIVEDRDEFAAAQRAPVEVLLGLIQALLALALVIAVLGIANTLGLSVFERTRELGMLRAMGLTVKQVRLLIQVEAAAIAVLGAALGVLAGTIMGVAVQRSQTDAGITELVIPWSVLFGYILIAAVVGVFAAWLPAVRASKLEILPSLKAD